MTRMLTAFAGVLLLSLPATAAVQTKKITYKDGDTTCHGFLAYDDAVQGPRPGVLVVHEWWGLNDYAKQRAEQLAKLGYVAFAPDMYGDGKVVDHPKDAGAMAGKVRGNVEAWRKRALAGLNVLKEQPQCDKDKLAAIGYCFGGSTALQLALGGTPGIQAVVSFHGALPAPSEADAKQVKAAILVCHGADDKFIPDEAIKTFRGTLDKAGVKYDFQSYAGAVHSFTVPEADKKGIAGMGYNKAADEASWAAMLKLFKDKLGK